jgi:hypothetical protein
MMLGARRAVKMTLILTGPTESISGATIAVTSLCDASGSRTPSFGCVVEECCGYASGMKRASKACQSTKVTNSAKLGIAQRNRRSTSGNTSASC